MTERHMHPTTPEERRQRGPIERPPRWRWLRSLVRWLDEANVFFWRR